MRWRGGGRARLCVLLGLAACLASAAPAFACNAGAGWTLLARKTVSGFIDDGERLDHVFEGCEFDRIIIFDDETAVRCTGSGSAHALRPKACIWARGHALKMCVEGKWFDVSTQW